jgi:hypothetical protein
MGPSLAATARKVVRGTGPAVAPVDVTARASSRISTSSSASKVLAIIASITE